MRLGEKLRYLREVEGTLRGLDREMTQQEVVRAVKAELNESISQSYLSQIESGARPHLTNSTRQLLARFFKVHPGYLVDDPEGFHTELISDVRDLEDQLDLWLIEGSERFRRRCRAQPRAAHLGQARRLAQVPAAARGRLSKPPACWTGLVQVLKPGEQKEGNRMTWEVFYFVCFLVGFLLSLLTFVAGAAHLHLPHGLHGSGPRPRRPWRLEIGPVVVQLRHHHGLSGLVRRHRISADALLGLCGAAWLSASPS